MLSNTGPYGSITSAFLVPPVFLYFPALCQGRGDAVGSGSDSIFWCSDCAGQGSKFAFLSGIFLPLLFRGYGADGNESSPPGAG